MSPSVEGESFIETGEGRIPYFVINLNDRKKFTLEDFQKAASKISLNTVGGSTIVRYVWADDKMYCYGSDLQGVDIGGFIGLLGIDGTKVRGVGSIGTVKGSRLTWLSEWSTLWSHRGELQARLGKTFSFV